MIGQHLYLRCRIGVYDRSATPGMKTAAVSESIHALELSAQEKLNQAVVNYSKIPDTVAAPNIQEADNKLQRNNRGILRVFRMNDAYIAVRTFRVKDRCTFSGNVSFSHSYIFTNQEKADILRYPEALTTLENYDSYDAVDARSGGLNQSNPIPINTELVMPGSAAAVDAASAFSDFEKNEFIAYIAALCYRISASGSVALLLPGIDSQLWNVEGGSKKGEQILSATMRLLPDCLVRFFSGVSYWDETVRYDGVKNLRLLILSGSNMDSLDETSYSVIDLRHRRLSCKGFSYSGEFGSFLWDNKDDLSEIDAFHTFIKELFGKYVDSIKKLPILMDTVTQCYLYKHGKNADGQTDPIKILKNILSLFNAAMLMKFPKILEIVNELFQKVIYSGGCDTELEKKLVALTAPPGASALGDLYDNMNAVLLHQIRSGKASAETEKFALTKITGDPSADHISRFLQQCRRLLSSLSQEPAKQLHPMMLRFLCNIYQDGKTDHELLNKIREILFAQISECGDEKRYDEILAVCGALLSDNTPRSYFGNVYDCMEKLTKEADEAVIQRICSLLSQHIRTLQFEKKDDPQVRLFFSRFFQADYPKSTYAYVLFPLFVRVLPSICEDHAACTNWREQYQILLLSDFNMTKYYIADSYLTEYQGLAKADSLFHLESCRLECNSVYLPGNEAMEAILQNTPPSGLQTAYAHLLTIYRLILKNGNPLEEHLTLLFRTEHVYAFYLYALENDNRISDALEADILKCQGYADYLIAAAGVDKQKWLLASHYYRLWKRLWEDQYLNDKELTTLIIMEEDRLCQLPEQVRAACLKPFCNEFSEQLNNNSKLAEASTETLLLLGRGITSYGWNEFMKGRSASEDTVSLINLALMLDSDKLEARKLLKEAEAYLHESKPNPAPKISHLETRIKRLIMEKSTEVSEKRALLGLIYTVMKAPKGAQCQSYLDCLGKLKNKEYTWDAPEYVVYGLKYLTEWHRLANSDKLLNYEKSFSQVLSNLIKDVKSNTFYMDSLIKSGDVYLHIKDKLMKEHARIVSEAAETMRDERLEYFIMPQEKTSLLQRLQGNLHFFIFPVTLAVIGIMICVVYLFSSISREIGLIVSCICLVIAIAMNEILSICWRRWRNRRNDQ